MAESCEDRMIQVNRSQRSLQTTWHRHPCLLPLSYGERPPHLQIWVCVCVRNHFLDTMGRSGTLWDTLGHYETLWDTLGQLDTVRHSGKRPLHLQIWVFVCVCNPLWDTMGHSWTLWDTLGKDLFISKYEFVCAYVTLSGTLPCFFPWTEMRVTTQCWDPGLSLEGLFQFIFSLHCWPLHSFGNSLQSIRDGRHQC